MFRDGTSQSMLLPRMKKPVPLHHWHSLYPFDWHEEHAIGVGCYIIKSYISMQLLNWAISVSNFVCFFLYARLDWCLLDFHLTKKMFLIWFVDCEFLKEYLGPLLKLFQYWKYRWKKKTKRIKIEVLERSAKRARSAWRT